MLLIAVNRLSYSSDSWYSSIGLFTVTSVWREMFKRFSEILLMKRKRAVLLERSSWVFKSVQKAPFNLSSNSIDWSQITYLYYSWLKGRVTFFDISSLFFSSAKSLQTLNFHESIKFILIKCMLLKFDSRSGDVLSIWKSEMKKENQLFESRQLLL